jgi:hypothetical protein
MDFFEQAQQFQHTDSVNNTLMNVLKLFAFSFKGKPQIKKIKQINQEVLLLINTMRL